MWSNYFRTSIRSLRRSSFFVIANVFCLGLAFALVVIGYFNFDFNNNFNAFFDDAGHIYKVNGIREGVHAQQKTGTSPMALKQYLDTMEDDMLVSRFQNGHLAARVGDELINQQVGFVDPAFLQIFRYGGLNDISPSLSNKGEVVITEEAAIKIFDDPDVVGKSLTLILPGEIESSFTVSSVIKTFPLNTSFRFSILLSFEDYIDIYQLDRGDWSSWVDGTFVKLQSKRDKVLIQGRFLSSLPLINDHNKSKRLSALSLDSLLDWPSEEMDLYQRAFVGVLHPASVLGTISSAVFVLLLACFNFINISITLSHKRLQEIALRKVLGAFRGSIIAQFMIENALLVFIALGIAWVISMLLIPEYNALFSFNLVQFEFLNWGPFLMSTAVLVVIVISIAGGYPSLYISSFSSLHIMRNRLKLGGKNKFLMILLTLQFVICFYNVFSLIVFVENAQYQSELSRGYQIEELINIPIDASTQYTDLASSLAENPRVTHISGTHNLVGFDIDEAEIGYHSDQYEVARLGVGEGYLENLRLKFINGRSLQLGDDIIRRIVVNQTFMNMFSNDLLHESITMDNQKYMIIGVVEDFNIETILLDKKIKPLIIYLSSKEDFQYLTARVLPGLSNQVEEELKALWYGLYPNKLFQGFLQEKVLKQLHETNHIVISINGFVAISALIISILGLYTTISLSIQRRIKEFGIRKALGASFLNIAYILNRRIMYMLLIASLLGLVGGYLFIDNLLDVIYAYHISISLRHFIYPIFVIFMVVIASVIWKVYEAATENPVKQLRSE